MIQQVTGKSVSEMFAFLAPFFARARAEDRLGEYRDHGQADIPFETRTVYELFFALNDKVDRLERRLMDLEQILKPE